MAADGMAAAGTAADGTAGAAGMAAAFTSARRVSVQRRGDVRSEWPEDLRPVSFLFGVKRALGESVKAIDRLEKTLRTDSSFA
jgi:hypothetical protein